MTEPSGLPPQQPRRVLARLFGAAADPSAPRPPRPRADATRALRFAAVVVGIEAGAIALGAVVLLYLTVTGSAASLSAPVAVRRGRAPRGCPAPWRRSFSSSAERSLWVLPQSGSGGSRDGHGARSSPSSCCWPLWPTRPHSRAACR